ncbi:MAG: IS30 family transposase [Oleispira sp.]|nr:IS30 family transposase [Oleispira sp.]
MPETYTHLTEEQRYQIYESLIEKLSHRKITQKISKHHSCVSREISRNQGLKGYRPRQAQSFAEQRKEEKPKYIKLTLKVQAVIKKNIGKEWSPEQIQGRLISEGHEMVCATTIYHYIRQDKTSDGELYKSLRHKKSYKKRIDSKDKRGQIIGRISIDERPAIVDRKKRLCDWKAETVIGKEHKGVLVTLAERCSRKTLIAHVKSKHAEIVSDAIIRLLKGEKENLHTITFDNGKEFAYHAKIKNALACDNYVAHPYCSWERGLNENHNGLIRQYLPKGMALDKVTSKEIKSILNKLNNRPRKSLGYQTPNEVYNAMSLAS